MADYTNRIVVDTASAVDNVSKLDKGLKAAGDSLDDVGKRGGRVADDGMKRFGTGLVQATRAAQDFQAAGMMGISNNIIEVGAAFGTLGVVAGAALTGVALNWKFFSGAIEDFASRSVIASLGQPFANFGGEVARTFKDAAEAAGGFFDSILGEAEKKDLTPLVEFETGLNKVQLQLKANREAQEELTKAGDLDAGQIARLNGLRAEQVKLLQEQERLQDRERIKKQYGEGATDEMIKSGEAFKGATKGGDARRLFDAIARQTDDDNAARVISYLEQGTMDPETLQRILGAGGGGVQDIITDFRLRTQGTNLEDAKKLQEFSDTAMIALRSSPFLHMGAGGLPEAKDSPVQNWSAPGPPKPEPILDLPEWSQQDFAAQAGIAPPAMPKIGPFGSISADAALRGQDVFPPRGTGGAAGKRRQQFDDQIQQLVKLQPQLDENGREQFAQAQALLTMLLQSAKNQEQQQSLLLQFNQALINHFKNGESRTDQLLHKLGALGDFMRQRNPSLLPSW